MKVAVRAGSALLTALLLPLATGACDTGTPPEPTPTVTGRWNGTGFSGIVLFTLELDLVETSTGRITGTGTIEGTALGPFSLTVRNGAHGHPDVLLSLFTPDHIDVNYSGRFLDEDRIAGLVNGSGFRNDSLTIVRSR